jgi:hypothetical protein
MKLSQIRYSLQRCKNGSTEAEHTNVLAMYSDLLAEYELTIDSFGVEWDVDKKDNTKIATGKVVEKYNKNLLTSLFHPDGILKD